MEGTVRTAPGFGTGYAAGLAVLPLVILFGTNFGAVGGWAAYVVGTVAAAVVGGVSGQRLVGVVAGQLTVVAGLALLLAPLFMTDW